MNRGLFITVEGSDGAGKTTQIDNIRKYLEAQGFETLCTREPGGTKIGEKLRDLLLDKENSEMDPVAEMLLYAAARAQHVSEVILPAIEAGKAVICDRFVDSSVAYQGYGRGLGKQVQEVNEYATFGLEPDITFFLDLSPEAGKKRIGEVARDRLEAEKEDFHRRVYGGYIAICGECADRVVRIDASRDIESVRNEICNYMDRLIVSGGKAEKE